MPLVGETQRAYSCTIFMSWKRQSELFENQRLEAEFQLWQNHRALPYEMQSTETRG